MVYILFPEFNLGPLHLLEPLAKEIFDLKKKEFIYKKTASGRLASHFSHLVDPQLGASVANYRRQVEEKAHMPTSLWK